MRKRNLLIFAALLLAAALLGWLLPTAVFRGVDQSLEGRPEPVSIRQIDLSYQSDLQFADRLRLLSAEVPGSNISSLERGVYRDEAGIRDILRTLLEDLTGFSFRVSQSNTDIVPVLMQFPEQGVFVAWRAIVFLNEMWSFEAILDDQTGALLGCSFEGGPGAWDNLFHRPNGIADYNETLRERVLTALETHYRTQLGADYSAKTVTLDQNSEVLYSEIAFLEDEQEQFRIVFMFVFPEGYFNIR